MMPSALHPSMPNTMPIRCNDTPKSVKHHHLLHTVIRHTCAKGSATTGSLSGNQGHDVLNRVATLARVLEIVPPSCPDVHEIGHLVLAGQRCEVRVGDPELKEAHVLPHGRNIKDPEGERRHSRLDTRSDNRMPWEWGMGWKGGGAFHLSSTGLAPGVWHRWRRNASASHVIWPRNSFVNAGSPFLITASCFLASRRAGRCSVRLYLPLPC